MNFKSLRLTKLIPAFALIFVALFSGCSISESILEDYVVKVNGETVSKGEFMVYLNETKNNFETIGGNDIWETDFDGQTADEVAKESALNSLQTIMITVQNSGISLTDEEREAAANDAATAYSALTDTEKEVVKPADAEKVIADKLIYSKAYNEITKDYVLSEPDFEKYFDSQKDSLTDMYTQYTIKTIFVQTKAEADEISRRARAGEEFDSLLNEYEHDAEILKSGGSESTLSKWQIENIFGVTFNLSEGEISGALSADGGYYVVQALKVTAPSDETLIEFARESYTNLMKQQLFRDEYSKWAADAVVERNSEVWDSITVSR